MQASQARVEAFAPIKKRILAILPFKLSDQQIFQVALCCSMRDGGDCLGFLFAPHVVKAVAKNVDVCSLGPGEWSDLCGVGNLPYRDAGYTRLIQSSDYLPHGMRLAAAMTCTLAEKQQSFAWSKAWTQALAHVALHLEDPITALETVIGTIVRSDHRRLDALTYAVDEKGVDAVNFSKFLITISESVL